MPEGMTEKELAEIERVWAEATPGPWVLEESIALTRIVGDGAPVIGDLENYSEESVAAICAAPEHVRKLLAEVRRLNERLRELENDDAARHLGWGVL